MTIEKLSDPQPEHYSDTLKLCAYGRYGSRKTLQVASLIDLYGAENVLVVSCESGLSTIASTVRKDLVIECGSLDDFRGAWAKAKKFSTEGDPHKRWIVLDGMSQVMEDLANEQHRGAEAYYEQKVLGYSIDQKLLPFGRFITNRDEIDAQKIYGKIGRDSEILLASWIKLRVNVYANYLEDMTGTTGREKSIPWGPDVPGKVGLKAVLSSFDYVFRLGYNAKGELVGGFDPSSPMYLSRTRDDRRRTGLEIPKEIIGFDLAQFIQKYLEGEK